MSKDPAFLFYPEKWIQGTASMMPEEKGVFIDLLSHQHQDGSLPTNTKRLAKMVGLSESDFLPIWETVKEKFGLNSDNRLVNRKLTEVVTERSTKSLTNKIVGQFASIIRLSNMSYEERENIKKQFKVEDFMGNSDRSVKERLTEWLALRSESIINIDNNSIIDKVKITENGKNQKPVNFRAQSEELFLKRIADGERAKADRDRQKNNQEPT